MEKAVSVQRPFVTQQEAQDMAKKIGAYSYIEVSSKDSQGVKELFDTVSMLGYRFATGQQLPRKTKEMVLKGYNSHNRCIMM